MIHMNIYSYIEHYNWENSIRNSKETFDVMRYYLSDTIKDEIKRIL